MYQVLLWILYNTLTIYGNICYRVFLSFTMDNKKDKFNLDNEKDVDKLLQMLENGELSDLDDMEGSEDEVEEVERLRKVREGEDTVDRRESETFEEVNDNINANISVLDTEPTKEEFQNKRIVRWNKQTTNPPNFEWIENDKNGDLVVLNPIEYFSKYITPEIFEQMAEYTNIYAHQQGKSQFKPTNTSEIET